MFKNPSFIFDILCTVVWLVLAIRYARKGFLAGVVQLTGNLISLFGARQFSGWAAGQVFERFFAGSFRDQIAASISTEGAVSLSGIAARYAGFLPESFRASIVEACERSISAVLNDNAILYQILTCADCLGAATDSVGRLITVEREQLYREVFGKNVELVL